VKNSAVFLQFYLNKKCFREKWFYILNRRWKLSKKIYLLEETKREIWFLHTDNFKNNRMNQIITVMKNIEKIENIDKILMN
jgi:hypothetical protein